jgi:hypothetical protein
MRQILPAAPDNEFASSMASDNERRELELGLNSLSFSYHMCVLLAKHGEADKDSCLNYARVALSILPNLVSISEAVYNGIVW